MFVLHLFTIFLLHVVVPQVATAWKGVKRFYSQIDIQQVETDAGEYWHVLIEGRPLRTNAMNELLVPSKGLAILIAAEFAAQTDTIIPATTPIYTLCSTAIDTYVHEDLEANAHLEAEMRAHRLSTFDRILARDIVNEAIAQNGKETLSSETDILAAVKEMQANEPEHTRSLETGRNDSGAMTSGAASGTSRLRDLLLDNLETDTACFRVDWDLADPTEKLLRQRQDRHYGPLLDWFQTVFDTQLGVAVGFQDVVHAESAYLAVEDCVDGASPWVKAALGQLVGTTKSSVISLAMLYGAVDVDGAFEASRVEEEWQIEENGFVEDGHDTSRAHTKLQLSSVATFLNFLNPKDAPVPLPPISGKSAAELCKQARIEREARVRKRRAAEDALVQRYRVALRNMALQEAAQKAAEKKAN